MKALRWSSGLIAATALLAGCGAGGGAKGCSGVTLETEQNEMFGRIDATITNKTNEPKLVTVAIVSDGERGKENTMRVDAKDVAETSVGNMTKSVRERTSLELVQCE